MKNPSKYLGNELNYFVKVLNSEKWSSTEGSWTGRLETEFAEKFKQEYAVAFNSGTSTMHAALLALGVKPGDEVISPAITVPHIGISTYFPNLDFGAPLSVIHILVEFITFANSIADAFL